MSIWSKPNPPDGTLGVGKGIWTTENGAPEWRKMPPEQIPLEWTGGRILFFADYRHQECIWLDSNKIAVTKGTAITVKKYDDYVAKTQKEIIRDAFEHSQWPAKIKWHEFITAFFHPSSHLEGLLSTQYTRPLSPIERARFIEKQACIKRAFEPDVPGTKIRIQIEEMCDPAQVPYWPLGSW